MTRSCIVLENIRSAYNVGNLIRTADALGYDVILSGYTPRPYQDIRVCKTALGAQDTITIIDFWNTREALSYCHDHHYFLIAGEITTTSIALSDYQTSLYNPQSLPIALVLGNEVTGVLSETLSIADLVLHIPMVGIKESLNVGQAGAILMWHLYNLSL